ncbi:MAG: hypothetical protein GQ540_03615 [Lutibacter sp.]|uniref:phage head completion protein n=1 Tax=Lutibacter sp. TaxID=1925666 RepID=UPI0019DF0D57|nr:head-tail adaptor protein [Lutibacter sp.]NOR27600.1 hypothetical protein [Lutibacter sp.]
MLQSNSKVSDGMGGFTDSWIDVRELKGVFMNRKAKELFSNHSEKVSSNHYFSVKNMRDLYVDESFRFYYNSKVYEIVFISNPGEKKNITIFHLEKYEDSGSGSGC